MTSKGNKGLVVLLTIIIVFGFAFLFLTPKYGPQVEIPFLNRGSSSDVPNDSSVNDIDQIAQEQVQKRSNAIDAAINDLTSAESMRDADVKVSDVSYKEFADTSLGCSIEGESYAQVVTPGYEVVLNVGDTSFDYRVSEDLQIIKVCN